MREYMSILMAVVRKLVNKCCVCKQAKLKGQKVMFIWKHCLIGYVSGKFPGFQALSVIISNDNDKLAVLQGGPYLIYGRPLILREMPEYFDFNSAEMSIVPVWIKLPNLPLKCWSSTCLSKIASVLGKTNTM